MDIGVVFPQYEIGADPAGVRDFAQAAEGLGFAEILAFDHVLGAEHDRRDPPLSGPYTEEHEFHEPLVLFAYLSALTERIRFTTGVLVLPQRQVALVAKQAAQVAVVSGGRLRLGIGVGWNHVEYEALGSRFTDRGARSEEQVQVLRALWARDIVDLDGRWHRIDRAGIRPRPPEPIPILFGGLSSVAYERAARLGDGFLLTRVGGGHVSDEPTEPVENLVARGEEIRGLVRSNGRDEDAFQLAGRLNYRDGAEAWMRDVEALEAGHFASATVNMMSNDLQGPGAHIGALERFAREVDLR